jgi:transmembrane sensor
MKAGIDRSHFTADDFIMDESFQRWIFKPDDETDKFWHSFLVENPHQRPVLQEAKQFLQVFTLDKDDSMQSRIQRLKRNVNETIDQGDHLKTITATPSTIVQPDFNETRRFSPKLWMAFAATVTVIIACSVWAWSAWSGQEYVTDRGHRSIITLTDGTKVWLNADSKLRTSHDFADGTIREVFLEGEAFFKVKRDVTKPFVVRSSDLKVRVLGTSFNVSAYPEKKNIETTLIEGSVSLETDRSGVEPVIMKPNQKAIYQRQSQDITLVQQADIESATGWRRGHLTFDNVELGEMIAAMERWFNVDIHVPADQRLSCRFSARVETKTLEEVLELFAASDGITYEIKGKDVYMRGFICAE